MNKSDLLLANVILVHVRQLGIRLSLEGPKRDVLVVEDNPTKSELTPKVSETILFFGDEAALLLRKEERDSILEAERILLKGKR
jgi:hypothetical protein